MYCHKCGTQVNGDMRFCPKCSTALSIGPAQSNAELAGMGEEPDEHEPSKLKKWWDKSSTSKRVLGVIVAAAVTIPAVILLISFLREFGYLLLGLLIVASFVIIIVKENQEERSEAKKTIIHIALWGVAIFAAVMLFATNTDFFTDLVKPGAGVREAYLTQYSKTVTIEDAFDDFFEKEKWSTYKENGYSYVSFSGVCEYLGEKVDARVIFKITGENFVVDHLDINGVEQSDILLYALLAKVYEKY